jgi:hypothetical protein
MLKAMSIFENYTQAREQSTNRTQCDFCNKKGLILRRSQNILMGSCSVWENNEKEGKMKRKLCKLM